VRIRDRVRYMGNPRNPEESLSIGKNLIEKEVNDGV
jgi:hypothetical protein